MKKIPTKPDKSATQLLSPAQPVPPTVSAAITTDRIQLNLQGRDRDSVLRQLVSLVIPPQEERMSETLFQALKAREDLCPTCVTEGVAIPHARNALVGMVDKPVLAYGCHQAGVDFGAQDGKPIRHFFLLCAPNVREHLQLLSKLARLLNNPAFRRKLDTATTRQQVLDLIRTTDLNLK
jgi:mannitol/fructose-specific phosphotransferase system IIA component (Ntr-type)